MKVTKLLGIALMFVFALLPEFGFSPLAAWFLLIATAAWANT